MPVLEATVPNKKIVLGVSSKPGDEAWVEIPEVSRVDVLEGIDFSADQVAVKVQILLRVVKDWNFTDKEGTKLPITEEMVRRLPFVDMAQIAQAAGIMDEIPTQKKSSS